ncbi:unnamed protein product [Clonostachys chloroleuca]|uniref:Cytochrome P450 n=1 Tax=Clonostachys chloroleuca TaxID=1926264 RepID=A0AA35M7H9_9HYPO|nr:unnamed protein product [Clonostachys chloroleuca]
MFLFKKRVSDQPPRLEEAVPYVTNVYQYMTNKKLFLERVTKALSKSPVVQCRLGPMNIYCITGASNIAAMFRPAAISDPWIIRILTTTAGYQPNDLEKFAQDTTGGGRVPRPGTEAPHNKRIWHAMHQIYDEHLAKSHAVTSLSKSFQHFFGKELDRVSLDGHEWEEVGVQDFLRQHMATAVVSAITGPRLIEINPDFIEAFWKYQIYAEKLAFGMPEWMNADGIRARETVRAMCEKWYQVSDERFDWGAEMSDVAFEENFGSRLSRELCRWGKRFDFSSESMGSLYCLLFFGLNSNMIFMTIWYLIEVPKNPDLLRSAKEAMASCFIEDDSGSQKLDPQKLASNPLLQSIYIEVLRVHVSINITRTLKDPAVIGGYPLPAGAVIQAPSHVAHLDEEIWGSDGHPASEFWGERHLKTTEAIGSDGKRTAKKEFSLGNRSGSFLPYGGGVDICPGRHLAKTQIILASAMLLTKFDIKFLGWVNPDGSPSKLPVGDDYSYAGAHALPPAGDMKLKWRRVA